MDIAGFRCLWWLSGCFFDVFIMIAILLQEFCTYFGRPDATYARTFGEAMDSAKLNGNKTKMPMKQHVRIVGGHGRSVPGLEDYGLLQGSAHLPRLCSVLFFPLFVPANAAVHHGASRSLETEVLVKRM